MANSVPDGVEQIADTVSLTAFHARPGEAVDRSQQRPVKLTKRNRTYAVVVSADWFERAADALDAVHGRRRAIRATEMTEDDWTFLETNGPTRDEVEADAWRT
jgi:prevent-host-death family protein